MKSNEWKIGMSSFSTNRINRETFEGYAAAGIEYMEISLPEALYPTINFAETQKLARETGVKIWSFHLPFSPYQKNNIASADSFVRKSTVKMQSEYIKRAANIGIKTIVIHPSGGPNEDDMRERLIENSMESLSSLAETAAQSGAVLAVENLPRAGLANCAMELKQLISADKRLKICFDTNHLLDEHFADFIPQFKGMIANIHVSDYDFRNERHWMPYEGKIDWPHLLDLLEEACYRGPFMYEVCLKALPSINRRELTFEECRANYEAVVNRRIPEIIGTPNLKVCDETAYYKEPIIEFNRPKVKSSLGI